MSTLRYCGEIRIRITYLERGPHRNGSYRCYLTAPGGAKVTIIVGAPAYLSHGVDSSEAFDETAHAAISFADNEPESDADWSSAAAVKADGTGWLIGRSEATAWGPLGSGATACALPANTNGS
jgi:hypothetical protein